MEVGKKYFEELIDKMKAERGVKQDVELTADDLKELANQFKAEYKAKIGADFPSGSNYGKRKPQQPKDFCGENGVFISLFRSHEQESPTGKII